jgi:hypothetical protein
MSLLLHAAGSVAQLAMANAQNVDELDLVGNCSDLNKIEFGRLLEVVAGAVETKRDLLVD